MPPVQLPPQHAPDSEQAPLSAMQAVALQRPPVQANEQHSVDVVHASPVTVHLFIEATHVLLTGSHNPEQQSWPLAQVWLKGRQNAEGAVSPPSCVSAPPSCTTRSRPAALPSLGEFPTFPVRLHARPPRHAMATMTILGFERGMLSPVVVRTGFGPR